MHVEQFNAIVYNNHVRGKHLEEEAKMKKLFDLELNEKERSYFGVIRMQALRAMPEDMLSQISYHERIVERMKQFNMFDDEGLRIEFYQAVAKYLNNMLTINF